MKANKKGFTLIELLAVIVILAIIALITVPVVINIINNAKKGAAEDSTYGVIEAAKLFWVSNQMNFENSNTTIEFTYNTTSKKWTTSNNAGSTATELEISGTKPTAASGGKITISNGEVTVVGLKFGDYVCKTENGKAVCTKSNS